MQVTHTEERHHANYNDYKAQDASRSKNGVRRVRSIHLTTAAPFGIRYNTVLSKRLHGLR